MEASIRRGVKSLVYTSTNGTLHTAEAGVAPASEADVAKLWGTTKPLSGYGRSKKAATLLVLANNGAANGQLRTTALMPGVIVGPREPRMLGGIINGDPVHLLPPEESGKLNFCTSTSLAKAHVLALDRLLVNDPRVAGHVFMMSDFVENVTQFEMNVRKVLNRPAERIIGLRMANVLMIASRLLNWLTNDGLNTPFGQLTSTSVSFMRKGPIFQSTAEAEEALGWRPVSQDDLLKELVQYYGVKK